MWKLNDGKREQEFPKLILAMTIINRRWPGASMKITSSSPMTFRLSGTASCDGVTLTEEVKPSKPQFQITARREFH